MKVLFVFVCFLTAALQARAVTIDVTGKNGESLFHAENNDPLPATAGDITIHTFIANNIPYEGSSAGIMKIFDLGPDTQMISNTEIKAYGWCFSVNGQASQTMPDQNTVSDSQDKILWYYCFAHYKDGQWNN